MNCTRLSAIITLLLLLTLSGCATLTSDKKHKSSSLMDYLYPNSQPKVVATIPTLRLPLRVGVAFVPGPRHGTGALSAKQERALLDRVSAEFTSYDYIESIEVIPSTYLRPQGSFDNLRQLQGMFGIDVIALLSYDQVQFTDEDALAFSYWTIIGAYLVSGEKNDTHTLLDTAVFDIESRKLLLRAPGSSQVRERATPVNIGTVLRNNSEQGFNQAADEMIVNLHDELTRFAERVKSAPAQDRPAPAVIEHRSGYSGGGGGGAALWAGLLALGLLSRRQASR